MKVFLKDWNGVLEDVAPHLDTVEDVYEADILVLWNDVTSGAPEMIREAHLAGIKTVVMMHGSDSATDYLPPRNYQPIADKYLTWGLKDYNTLLSAGVSPSKIVVTGSSTFHNRFNKKTKHKGTNILFVPLHSILDGQYNDALYEELQKTPYNITVKTTQEHKNNNFENQVKSSRFGDSKGHADACYDALKTADLVVTNYWGTMGLLAAYMDIPLICTTQFQGHKHFDFVLTGMNSEPKHSIAEVCALDDLADTIEGVLENKDKRKEERRCVAEYYLNKGHNDYVVENIVEEIKKTYKDPDSNFDKDGNIDTTIHGK